MGESRSAGELAGRLTGYAAGLAAVNRTAVGEVALTFKGVYGGNVGKFARMRNVGRKGVAVRARYDIKGTQNATALVKATPAGAAAIAERGAKPHPIAPKRRNRSRVIRLANGDFVRGPIAHPGMRGNNAWARTKQVIGPRSRQIFQRAHNSHLRKVFGG
jgi:hypothetical protein